MGDLAHAVGNELNPSTRIQGAPESDVSYFRVRPEGIIEVYDGTHGDGDDLLITAKLAPAEVHQMIHALGKHN